LQAPAALDISLIGQAGEPIARALAQGGALRRPAPPHS